MKNIILTVVVIIAVILLAITVAAGISLWQAWLATDLWLWFIVPLGMAPIGTLHMWGIHLMLVLLMYSLYSGISNMENSENTKKSVWERLGYLVIGPPITWFVGYTIHSYM